MGQVLICAKTYTSEVEQLRKLLSELQWQVRLLCEKTPEESIPCPVLTPRSDLRDWKAWMFFLQTRQDLILNVDPVAEWRWPALRLRLFQMALPWIWSCPQVTWVGQDSRWSSDFLKRSQLVLCSHPELLRKLLKRKWVQPGRVDLLDITSPSLFSDEFLNHFNRRLEALLSNA